jgi:uncharacterized OB-fold protein
MSDTTPDPEGVSAPFWAAAAAGQLVLQRCSGCGRHVWYPRAQCPHCYGADLEWTESEGLGTVYAISVHHRSPDPALAELTPYAVVLVDLDEGVRIMARATDTDAFSVAIGQRMRWRPDPAGGKAFVFSPA